MPHFLACVSKHQKMLYVHTSDHETKRVSPLVLESACQGMGEEKWEVLLGPSRMGISGFPSCSPGLGGVHTAHRKHVYLQLLSGGFLSVSAIHTKWGPPGAMAGLSS